MATERVPFALAIKGEKLLKKRFDSLSLPQQVALKAFYGLPLTTERELDIWSMFQGGAEYDDLGFVTKITRIPYVPKEYDTLVLYVGRRSGKTDAIISTATAYEITLGGHLKYVRPGQQAKVPFIAQTAGDAQKNMNFIKLALEESELLKKELAPEERQVASELRLVSNLIVEPLPANKSVGRGHAIPVWIGDETAFWYTDSNAANPDYEVQRAISWAQLQFPHAKQFLGTTPWAEQGIAWEYYNAGTEGRKLKCDVCKKAKVPLCEHPLDERAEYEGVLVIHASTAAMENPVNTRKRLIQLRKRDPEAYPRESLAQTLKVVSGWLNPQKIESSIQAGHYERAPITFKNANGRAIPTYVAAMDPAFRNDYFAFTILHHDEKEGIVQDLIRYWKPEKGDPLKPGGILDEIKTLLDAYGINTVYSDQYQLESLQQLAQDRHFTINGYDFTGTSKAKITGSFKVVMDQERLKLLDHEELKLQLQQLQKQVGQNGSIRIAAPNGKHDDLAMVLILAARIVMWLKSEEPTRAEPEKTVEADHVKMFLEQIQRRRDESRALMDDYD